MSLALTLTSAQTEAIKTFLATITSEPDTEIGSIQPEHVEKRINAFIELCQEMKWEGVLYDFRELLREKSNQYFFRKNGIVPNWYHEFRFILPILSTLLSDPKSFGYYEKYAGLQSLLCTALRHDSKEDFGKTMAGLYAPHEKRINEDHDTGRINDETFHRQCAQMASFAHSVDLLSHKTKRLEEIEPTKKPPVIHRLFRFAGSRRNNEPDSPYLLDKSTGQKIPLGYKTHHFYSEHVNDFYMGTLNTASAYIVKCLDTIDGSTTRFLASFSMGQNLDYARLKRNMYSHNNMVETAKKNWPELSDIFDSLDCTMGMSVEILEYVGSVYDRGSKINLDSLQPINIDRFLKKAGYIYQYVPKSDNPLRVMIEQMERAAQIELEQTPPKFTMANILERSIFPAAQRELDGRQNIFPTSFYEFCQIKGKPYFSGDKPVIA